MQTYLKLADGCTVLPFDTGRDEEYMVCMPNGRQFKINPLARRILERLDGQTTLGKIVSELNADSLPLTADHLRTMLQQYINLGIVSNPDQTQPSKDDDTPPTGANANAAMAGLPFLLTFNLLPQRWVAWTAKRLHFLYNRIAVSAGLALIVGAHYTVYTARPDFAGLGAESYLFLMTLVLASVLVHEFGHAAALSRYGGTPGPIGVGLYLLMPVFFADVSQIWRFSRKRRIAVDVGGVYFQQLSFVVLAACYLATGRPELVAACHVIDFMVIMALNPIFRFDGYWVLVDYLAFPQLQSIGLRHTANFIKRLFGRRPEKLQVPSLQGLQRYVFNSYAALSSLFLVAILWIAFRYLTSAFSRFPTAFALAAENLVTAFANGEAMAFLGQLLTLFFILAIPLTVSIGMLRYIFTILKWVAGRPSLRRYLNPFKRATFGEQRAQGAKK